MDRSTVKRLAIQSGFQPDSAVFLPMLHSFAEKVIENFLAETGQYVTNDTSRESVLEKARAEEREACAKVCDSLVHPSFMTNDPGRMWILGTTDCAAAIRKQGYKVES